MPQIGDFTQIPEAEDALGVLLTAAAPEGVDVSVGEKVTGPRAEQIIVGGWIEDWSQRWSLTGGQGIADLSEEEFVVPVQVIVKKKKHDYELARDRAFEIARAVGNALTEVTLGGAVFSARCIGGDADSWLDKDGRGFTLLLRIAVSSFDE